MPTTPPTAGRAELFLTYAGSKYPCVHLDPGVGADASERESFVELGPGHLPMIARVWISSDQIDSMPPQILDGTGYVGITMNGVNPAAADSVYASTGELKFAPKFRVFKADLARSGVNSDVLEVWLASEQRQWAYTPINRSYNILSRDRRKFVSGSTSSSVGKTYAEVLTDVAGDIGAAGMTMPFTPAAKPHNLTFRNCSGSSALARLLRPLGIQVVADPFTSTTAIYYRLAQLDSSDPAGETTKLLALAAKVGEAGPWETDNAYSLPQGSIPKTLRVLFPKYPTPVPTADRYTAIDKIIEPSGVAGSVETCFVGDHFDVSSKTYTEVLDDIAAERAEIYYDRVGIPHLNFVFAGGYPIITGSIIRRVRWSIDCGGYDPGWRTQVWVHGLIDQPREDMQVRMGSLAVPAFNVHNDLPGLAMLPRDDGTEDMQAEGTNGQFPVLVKWIAGSDGTVSTFASWTYDLFDLADTGLATALNAAPLQPYRSAARVFCGHVVKAADGTVGMAYYDTDGTIKLWDCLELRGLTIADCLTSSSSSA